MGRIFHWLPCVRSNSAKGNDSSMPTGPESPKLLRTPAPYKGEKYNSKNHGWRSWGKQSAVILKPESEDQRRDINEDMVKAIGEYMAQRPFQYRKQDEPVDQQKQQSTELVKEKSVKSLSKPHLETEIVKTEEPAENELTSPHFVPAPIAAIEYTKTPPSSQTHSGKSSSDVKSTKPVQIYSTSTERLVRPTLQTCVATSSTSLSTEPSEESTGYAVLSQEKSQTPQEGVSVNRKPLEKSASHAKSLDFDKSASASVCKQPSVAPTHTSERTDPLAQCSVPRQPFHEKPLFTKNIAACAERTPNAPILVREQSCVSSPYLTVAKDVRPTVSVKIEPPLVSNTSVIMGSGRAIDSKSRSKIYVSTEQGPRPTLSVVVNPPLAKSLISSNNELPIEAKSGISAGKPTLLAKEHMFSAGNSESELSNKTKAKLLKDPLGVTRSAASLGKTHAIEKMPSHLNMKQTSNKTRPDSLVNTPLKSRSAVTVDSDIGPSASKGMVRREKSKGSETSLGCSRQSHRYQNL
ncbi:uncharacterized protein LOC106666339 isoform X2 [Cimex lectularius]|uniref:Uncharacterized protein n=1 Tax=Cimex lectularius TaxID=79782 RepID=A0A8I6RP88_CIMLE|nr:uncharacterized protein LOC106666339 isoform X2 [Cimex lectularius]